MRTITLHPLSLVAGVALAAAVFFCMSQGTTTPSSRVEYGPQPREFVRIVEGASFVVPVGKVFVPTAIGQDRFFAGNTMLASLNVNGAEICHTYIPTPLASMVPISEGLSFPSGSAVDASHVGGLTGTVGQVWGYVSSAPTAPGTGTPAIRVAFTAPARDCMSIPAGTSYVVPQGKLFVATAVGDLTDIAVNGATVYMGGMSTTPIQKTRAMPQGLVVQSGSSITTTSQWGGGTPPPCSQLWGYLVSQ